MTRVGTALAALIGLSVVAGACSDSPGGGAGGAGGTIGGTGGGDGCSSIANVGETVTQTEGVGAEPTPMGGTIADGTYVLTKDEVYPPVSANVPSHKRETLEISGTLMKVAIESDAGPSPFQATATLAVDDAALIIQWQCGASGTFTQGFTATATELIVMSSNPPGSVQTFAKL